MTFPDRAYSTLQIKSFDAAQRVIEGYASTPTLDDHGHVMEPSGATFVLPHPLLWQHRQDRPIGEVFDAKVTSKGIYIKARLAKAGLLPWIDEAVTLITAGLVKGFSVGLKPKEYEPIRTSATSTAMRFTKWIWRETSCVTIPANSETTILAIKQADAPFLAALGGSGVVRSLPGVAGALRTSPMNYSEQIEAVKSDLTVKSSRLQELETKEENEGPLSAEEVTERDTLQDGVESLSLKVKRLKALEDAQSVMAQPIAVTQTANGGRQAVTKTSPLYVPKVELAPGIRFARYAMAKAAGRGSYSDTLAFAQQRGWATQTPEIITMIKADAGTTTGTSPGWGAEFVESQTLVSEYVTLVRDATVLNKITGFRRVPPNVTIQVQTGGSTVAWVGETGVKPVGELALTTMSVGDHKVAGIVVLSVELVRSSRPSAEEAVRNDLVEQMAAYIDQQFLDPSVAAGASNPASVTNGVASPAATGTDADALLADLNTALATFDTANIGTDTVHIITTSALARGISTLRNALGQVPSGLGMTPQGGTILGYPVIVSNAVPSGTLILIKANEIFMADEGRVRLDASDQATLDMNGGASPTFNLWQRNCVGIRAEQFISWAKRRAEAVAVIDTAAYGPTAGS